MYVYVCICIHMYVHVRIFTYMYVYVYIFMYMFVYTDLLVILSLMWKNVQDLMKIRCAMVKAWYMCGHPSHNQNPEFMGYNSIYVIQWIANPSAIWALHFASGTMNLLKQNLQLYTKHLNTFICISICIYIYIHIYIYVYAVIVVNKARNGFQCALFKKHIYNIT